MKNVVKVLFYINSELINIYLYEKNEFYSIERAGERDIVYDESFENWLKSAISYSNENDYLDFLIITDDSINLKFNIFNLLEETEWSKEDLILFIEKDDIFKLKDIYNENNNFYLSYEKKTSYFDKCEELNFKIISKGFKFKSNKYDSKKNQNKSKLFEYYFNKMEREKDKNLNTYTKTNI